MRRDTIAIVPAFNEAATVAKVVRELLAVGLEVVVVDDGSEDQTRSAALRAGARVVSLPTNLGVGAALRCGFRYAVDEGFSSAIQCDADGQHDPEYCQALMDTADSTNSHLVIGSRFASTRRTFSVGVARRTAMWLLAKVLSRATGETITDATSGFRLIRGDLLRNFSREFPSYYLGDTFEASFAAARAGYTIREVAVPMTPRLHGRSSASSGSAIRLIAKVLLTSLLGLHMKVPPPSDS